MDLKVEDELKKIWGRIPTSPDISNVNFDIEAYKKLLDIFQVGQYYYFILNVRNSTIEFLSPEIVNVLGHPHEVIDLDFFVNLIHPDDLPIFLNFEVAVEDFFKGIPPDKLFDYKVQYDFRVRRADGSYIRMLNQFVIIQHSANSVLTFVINTDINHLKADMQPRLSFLGYNGQPSYYNVYVKDIFKPSRPVFTRREKDVLKGLAAGLRSQQISEALCISKLTVDSHRKNLLKKANARSTTEVICKAYDNGWI